MILAMCQCRQIHQNPGHQNHRIHQNCQIHQNCHMRGKVDNS